VRKHVITPTDVVRDAYISKINYLVESDQEDLVAALVAEYAELLGRSDRPRAGAR